MSPVTQSAKTRSADAIMRNARSLCLATTALISAGYPISATAGGLPTGGQYALGTGTIHSGIASVTIRQSSTRGIIDWQNFSIGANKSVVFKNGTGATLNEVTGKRMSLIAGGLKATGSLYLINSSGVIISGTGRVLTQGNFGVSTNPLNVSSDLERKRTRGDAAGLIVNNGSMTSNSGNIRLDGQSVRNAGEITVANDGTVRIGGANSVVLKGRVTAQGNAKLGGKIAISGRTIDIGGHLTAKGAKSGGAIDIGGVDTKAVRVSQGAVLNVSAKRSGAGGIINMTSSLVDFAGAALAKGGPEAGNGGRIDISADTINTNGASLVAQARHGTAGDLLLDPSDLTIGSTAAQTIDATLNNGTDVTLKTDASGTTGPGIVSGDSGDIYIAHALSWDSAASLTIDSYHSVFVSDLIKVSGEGGLVIETNDGGSNGDLAFNQAGRVDFVDGSGALSINGTDFTFVNNIALLASDIASNPDGDFALAQNISTSRKYSASPISTEYGGTFEGLGNQIQGLRIKDSSKSDVIGDGLFSQAAPSAIIRDLDLTDVSILSNASNAFVGGLVGSNAGTIINVAVSGTVNATNRTDGVGGVIGYNNGTVEAATFSGTVAGRDNYVGGLIGWNDGEGLVLLSSASGSVVGPTTKVVIVNSGFDGGLVGFNVGRILQSSASNAVANGVQSDQDVGGMVGGNFGLILDSQATGSASVGDSDGDAVGGLTGYNGGIVDSSSASGNVTGGFFGGGLIGDEEGGVAIRSYASGNVTAPQRVVSPADPVEQGYGGLIGGIDYLAGGGSVVELCHATGAVTGYAQQALGGLVGVSSEASVTYSYATGKVFGANKSDLGGLIGLTAGTVSSSFATGEVKGGTDSLTGGLIGLLTQKSALGVGLGPGLVEDSYSKGTVYGGKGSDVGGLVGENNATVEQTYTSSKVEGANGAVIGGLIGLNYAHQTLSDNYWDTSTGGEATAGVGGTAHNGNTNGVFGLTTTELRASLPTGFDPSIWVESDGLNGGLPYLIEVPPA